MEIKATNQAHAQLPIDPLACARLIDVAGQSAFSSHLLEVAAQIAAVEEIFAWTGLEGSPPETLLTASLRSGQEDRVKSYAGRFFRSDPLLEPGGPDGFFVRVVGAEEIGFAEYRRICFARPLFDHKISFIRRVAGRSIVLNFYLREGSTDPDVMFQGLTTLATVAIGILYNRITQQTKGVGGAIERMERRIRGQFDQLSTMEARVVAWLSLSVSPARIAKELGVRPTTVKTYRLRALAKSGCRDVSDLLAQVTG